MEQVARAEVQDVKPHIYKRGGAWFVSEGGKPIARRYTFEAACIFAFLRIGPT